jgi:hypothetical protein
LSRPARVRLLLRVAPLRGPTDPLAQTSPGPLGPDRVFRAATLSRCCARPVQASHALRFSLLQPTVTPANPAPAPFSAHVLTSPPFLPSLPLLWSIYAAPTSRPGLCTDSLLADCSLGAGPTASHRHIAGLRPPGNDSQLLQAACDKPSLSVGRPPTRPLAAFDQSSWRLTRLIARGSALELFGDSLQSSLGTQECLCERRERRLGEHEGRREWDALRRRGVVRDVAVVVEPTGRRRRSRLLDSHRRRRVRSRRPGVGEAVVQRAEWWILQRSPFGQSRRRTPATIDRTDAQMPSAKG